MSERPGGRPPRPTSDGYEKLVEGLVLRFASTPGVTTTWIKQNVKITGDSGPNQIDVVWDFTDEAGADLRIVFEARSYAKPLTRGALHAFRSVVDDIQSETRPVLGVMVTTEGYQKGAKSVAETYGITVLELRSPTPKDWKGRIQGITLQIEMRVLILDNVRVSLVDGAEGVGAISKKATLTDAQGVTRNFVDVVLEGELGSFAEPREVHEVRRDFDPPLDLQDQGALVSHVVSIPADVGDSVAPPVVTTMNFKDRVPCLLKNGLTDARVWLAADGKVWTSDVPST